MYLYTYYVFTTERYFILLYNHFFSSSFKIIHFRLFLFQKHLYIFTHVKNACIKSLSPLTAEGGGGSKAFADASAKNASFFMYFLSRLEAFINEQYRWMYRSVVIEVFDLNLKGILSFPGCQQE